MTPCAHCHLLDVAGKATVLCYSPPPPPLPAWPFALLFVGLSAAFLAWTYWWGRRK